MRNDYGNKPRAKKAEGGRTGKQFGGGLNRPLGGVGAPVRPLGFKGGKRVGKQFGGGLPIQPAVAASPMGVAAPGRRFGMKHGSKSKSVNLNLTRIDSASNLQKIWLEVQDERRRDTKTSDTE